MIKLSLFLTTHPKFSNTLMGGAEHSNPIIVINFSYYVIIWGNANDIWIVTIYSLDKVTILLNTLIPPLSL